MVCAGRQGRKLRGRFCCNERCRYSGKERSAEEHLPPVSARMEREANSVEGKDTEASSGSGSGQTEQSFRRSLRRLRLQNGMAVLYVSMGAMVALVVLDVAFSLGGAAERALIGNAFEAFKLIAVTVLGYLFGANQSKPEE